MLKLLMRNYKVFFILILTVSFFLHGEDVKITLNSNKAANLLFIGDSYLQDPDLNPRLSWPRLILSRIKESGFPVNPPEIISYEGLAHTAIPLVIEKNKIKDNYSAVFVMAGLADLKNRRPVTQVRKSLERTVRRLVISTGGKPERIILFTIPNMPGTGSPDRFQNLIDTYNDLIREQAHILGLTLFDIEPLSRMSRKDDAYLKADGITPSLKMHRYWAEIIFSRFFVP